MHEGDRDRALADRRRHAFDVAGSDVADGEHAGQAGFEQMGRPRERPVRGGQIVLRQIGPGLDEPLGVERDAPVRATACWAPRRS